MGRSRHRLSRGLIGILIVTITIGLIFYVHNLSKSTASEKPKVTSASAAPLAGNALASATPTGPAANGAPKSEVSIGPAPTSAGKAAPTTKPATQPVTVAKSKSASAVSANPLADGKAKIDSGDLLAARRILNGALIGGKLSDADATAAKEMLNTINATVVFSPKRFADDEYGGSYSVQKGESLTTIAPQHNITPQYLARVNGISDPRKLRAGATIKVATGPFHALVEKHKFNMEIWVGGEPYTEGATYITSFGVGLGKDDSTPTGKWIVQPGNKIKNPTYYSPRGEGVIDAGDPKNPLGQFWLGLAGVDGHAVGKTSYGIHGTIDPTSIGKQESMGCIRMRNEDVAQVFELLVEGKSTVTVKD